MIGRDDLWRSDQQINQQGKKPMMKALSISKSRYVKKFLVQPKEKKKHCPILSYLKMGFSYTVTIVCVCILAKENTVGKKLTKKVQL